MPVAVVDHRHGRRQFVHAEHGAAVGAVIQVAASGAGRNLRTIHLVQVKIVRENRIQSQIHHEQVFFVRRAADEVRVRRFLPCGVRAAAVMRDQRVRRAEHAAAQVIDGIHRSAHHVQVARAFAQRRDGRRPCAGLPVRQRALHYAGMHIVRARNRPAAHQRNQRAVRFRQIHRPIERRFLRKPQRAVVCQLIPVHAAFRRGRRKVQVPLAHFCSSSKYPIFTALPCAPERFCRRFVRRTGNESRRAA